MALFSRSDRTFNLELERADATLVERVHLPGAQPKRIDYPDAAAAFGAYLRRIAVLVAEGWHLTVADADLGRCVASDPAMEARIADGEHLAVYADWLIEHGDPCGELAALRAREESEPSQELRAAIEELELLRADELFGLFALLPGREDLHLVWRTGWIEAIEVPPVEAPVYRTRHPTSGDAPLGTLVGAALLAPMARFARRLTFRRVHTPYVRAAIAMSARRDRIRALELLEPSYAQEMLDALPGLEEIAMPAGSRTPRGHEGVRRIALASAPAHARDKLLAGDWPALESLVITSRYEISGALAVLAEQPFVKHLRYLSITAPLETPIVRILRESLPHVQVDAS